MRSLLIASLTTSAAALALAPGASAATNCGTIKLKGAKYKATNATISNYPSAGGCKVVKVIATVAIRSKTLPLQYGGSGFICTSTEKGSRATIPVSYSCKAAKGSHVTYTLKKA